MAIRLIFAEASGSAFAAYEFSRMPEGEYSIGEGNWPPRLAELLFSQRTVLIFVAADENYQGKFHFTVDASHKPIRLTLPPPAPASKP
jgi:hypothetical protein